jgi:hypothetical protein
MDVRGMGHDALMFHYGLMEQLLVTISGHKKDGMFGIKCTGVRDGKSQ